jgi:outer membrane protein assembly factor BamD
MFNNINFLLIVFLLILASCSDNKKKISIIEEEEIESQMISAYKKGMEALETGEALFAAKKFNEAELLYPQSDWAPKSVLMAAYSYYSQNYFVDAVFELERYLNTYPNDKNISYANFLIAMCYFESIVDEKKDLGPIVKAKKQFEIIINKYPNTDFAIDSKYKLDLLNNMLAAKEMYIAKHYLKKQKWVASINRYKSVYEKYETTDFVEEALHRLVEVHYKIGLIEESKKYASILGYNYLSSRWYKESYRVFNKDYKISQMKKKIKKDKKFTLKKFKSLFD